MNKFRAFSLLLVLLSCACGAGDHEAPIANTAAVSGPIVHVSSPFGLRYRPGRPFPLRVSIKNPGAPLTAEVVLTEGGDNGGRLVVSDRILLDSGSTRVSTPFLLRAPAVTANLTLTIRELRSDGTLGNRPFTGSLANAIWVLPAETPLMLACGLRNAALAGAISIAPRDFPEDATAYDAVDLLVLGDASFKQATPAAQNAVREWLLGGGRLLLADNTALQPAVLAGLLPLPRNAAFGSDLSWWEQHAGVKAEHILNKHNLRPVYVRLPLGLGQVVFVFPGTAPEIAQEKSDELFHGQVLQRQRDKIPDFRVQSDRFDAFTYESGSSVRQPRAMLFILLGALMLCAALGWSANVKSRWEAWAAPAVLVALLAVLIANTFPLPDLLVSRVELTHAALDGRATLRQEWALTRAFRNADLVDVTAVPGATVTPLYTAPDFLPDAAVEYAADGGSLKNAPVYPEQPSLFYAQTLVAPDAPAPVQNFKAKESAMTIAAPPLPENLQKKLALLIHPPDAFVLIRDLDALEGFTVERYNNAQSALAASFGRPIAENELKARTKMLTSVARMLAGGKKTALVLWDDTPGGDTLLNVDRAENDTRFRLFVAEAAVGAFKRP